jgi:molybdate transport system regulatory protein
MRSPRFIDALGHGPSDKRIDLLRGIASTGSISQAAREAGVSYKAAWQAIDTLTNLAGVPLVERAVGGAGGGGALLTAHGGHLLELADALDAARREVHARWSGGGEASARADATVARLAVRTSMRNQLPATINALATTGRTVRVQMLLGEGDGGGSIAARITQESAELLGLATGMTVIALCKATAVRVVRFDAAGAPATRRTRGNRLAGSVASALRGEGGDEIAVAIAGGLQLVGFAPAGSGLRVRQRVTTAVDESAVVVALPA